MVIINDTPFSDENNNFNYPFSLDHFQKHALNSINKKNNTLITAHTGSGKTLPAEYAIQKTVFEGKRVIYTSPIKSLSNQKYYDFKNKFPNITFGLITGDIKCNPCAQCLIMTTEILRNSLFENKMKENVHNMFEMDFNKELGCIIYDEVHYINDVERGRVWEESIMLNPTETILVMLSATISRVEHFAQWVEDTTKREVEICPTDIRVVPLNHFLYINAPDSAMLRLPPDKKQLYKDKINQIMPLKNKINPFNDSNYYSASKFVSALNKNNAFVKPSFVLNKITELMKERDMLPAICFVFSRKMVEKYASMVNISLVDNAYDIEQFTHHILKHSPQYKDHIETPEFKKMMRLLTRGIAIHHSGLIPIFKEVIELLFANGYIKLLFATETFAVGVNMPTKTVLFTQLQKINNGGTYRNLLPQEYTQMAGRAGRRGLDKIGYVIHLCNLMKDVPSHIEYKNIISGRSQEIISKFKIHNNLILRLMSSGETLSEFTKSSMIKHEFTKQIEAFQENYDKIKKTVVKPEITKELVEYHSLYKEYNCIGHSNRGKKIYKKMNTLLNSYNDLETQHKLYMKFIKNESEMEQAKIQLDNTKTYIDDTIYIIKEQLKSDNFLLDDTTLSPLGISATHIQEGHSLILSELLFNKQFQELSSVNIACVLSVFAPIRTQKEINLLSLEKSEYYSVLSFIKERNTYYMKKDTRYVLDIAEDYTFQLNICDIIQRWCKSETPQTLNSLLCELNEEGIFTGEFIKAILKINAIAKELSSICELHNLIELKQKLDNISEKTMKHIVSNFSLYL